MQSLRNPLLTLFLFLFSWTTSFGQDVDENLILGKWKFVNAALGQSEKDYNYNGNPLLTFEGNGTWITEDTNPKYRQSGIWKIEKNILVRDPEVSGLGDIGPYTRAIEKLSDSELVFSAVTTEGVRTITFYFTKIKS